MRIALFTPFSPDIGGGSVQLRSHLGQLSDLNVEWYYLAPAPVGGASTLAGPSTHLRAARLGSIGQKRVSAGFYEKRSREITEKLDADLYWVVAHYEGISVAAELLRMGKPVHLTVHDDPLAILIMSRRFRPRSGRSCRSSFRASQRALVPWT